MTDQSRGHTRTLSILTLAFVAATLYVVSIYLAYPQFQNARLIDPLAEVNSLVPLYYVAIGMTAVLGVACLYLHIDNKYLHLLLLWMFAMMLWFTPYYLAGFVRLPDGPWHVGVALHISDVLNGDPVAFAEYAWAYPGSFFYHRALLTLVGLDPAGYIAVLFPFVCISLFVLMWYVLVVRLFDGRVALLSMLAAVPGLHYVQSHASPHTLAALLMLAAFLLALTKGPAAKVLAVATVAAIVMCHPTTPLLLAIFLAATLLASAVYSRRFGRAQVALASVLAICLAGWYLWLSYYHTGPCAGVTEGQMPHQVDVPGGLGVAQYYALGTAFVYAGIYNLNKAVYLLYAIAALAAIAFTAVGAYVHERRLGRWAAKLGGIQQSQALMAVAVPPLLVLSALLAETAPCLLETGLSFAVLAISCVVASVVMAPYWHKVGRGIVYVGVLVGVLFLTLSFPLIAYYIDGYSSFPESEEMGLKFLATSVPMDDKVIAASSASQVALYLDEPLHGTVLLPLHWPVAPDLSEFQPHIVVFRSTGYYYAAMRHELSFHDNRYSRYSDFVDSNRYDKVYSNPAFAVYSDGEEPP